MHKRKCIKLAALAVVTTILAGCATTPAGLEKPQYATTYVLNIGYELVLKNIVEAHAECTNAPILPIGQVIYDVHDYPHLEEAKIVEGSQGIGRQIISVVHIKSINGATQLTVYLKGRSSGIRERYHRWAQGSRDCSLPRV